MIIELKNSSVQIMEHISTETPLWAENESSIDDVVRQLFNRSENNKEEFSSLQSSSSVQSGLSDFYHVTFNNSF